MNAAIAAGAKKVVVTSSVVSIGMGHPVDKIEFTEDDWSKPEEFKGPEYNAYGKSKTLAEKKAWEILEDHNKKSELVTINPGLIIGPNLNKGSFSSGDLIG